MRIQQTQFLFRSFVWSFGDPKKGFDSGAQASYSTPIELRVGDNISSINVCILSKLASATSSAVFAIADSTGSALNNNGTIAGVLPAPPPFNFPQQAGTTQNTVLNSGFMKLIIRVEDFTSGIVRFDFGIIRPF